jgi:hypothetical protein
MGYIQQIFFQKKKFLLKIFRNLLLYLDFNEKMIQKMEIFLFSKIRVKKKGE